MISRQVLVCCTRLSLFLLMTLPAGARASEPAPAAPRHTYQPFDLTYLPAVGDQGLIAFRPAEMARHATAPEISAMMQTFLALLSQMLPEADLEAAPPPDFANIQECVLSLSIQVTTPMKDERGTVMAHAGTPCVIRTVSPFNWDRLLHKWFPRAEVKRRAGRPYLRMAFPVPPGIPQAPEELFLAFYTPDTRTLACGNEDEIIELLDRREARGPAPTPPPGWEEVNRELAALVLDLREERPLSGEFPPDYPWGSDLNCFIDATQTLAVGLSVDQHTRIRLVGTCPNSANALQASRALRRLLFAAMIKLVFEDPGTLRTFAMELLTELRIETSGSRFTATTSGSENVIKLLVAAIHGLD